LRLLLLKAAALTFSQIGRKGQWKVVRFKKLLRFKLLSAPLFSHRITHKCCFLSDSGHRGTGCLTSQATYPRAFV
jgi:hypothetical protein